MDVNNVHFSLSCMDVIFAFLNRKIGTLRLRDMSDTAERLDDLFTCPRIPDSDCLVPRSGLR